MVLEKLMQQLYGARICEGRNSKFHIYDIGYLLEWHMDIWCFWLFEWTVTEMEQIVFINIYKVSLCQAIGPKYSVE